MFSSERLKARRLAMGLTLEEVGEVAGISRSAVQKYEKGIIKNIYTSTIEAFAQALHCSPAYLTCWTDDPLEGMRQPENSVVLQKDEADILEAWREATDSARESALMVLRCNRRPIAKKETAI